MAVDKRFELVPFVNSENCYLQMFDLYALHSICKSFFPAVILSSLECNSTPLVYFAYGDL